MRLLFNARAISGQSELDTAIRAVTVAEMNGEPLVFASNGAGGGVSVYHLTGAGTLELYDSALFAPLLTATLARDTAVVQAGGDAMLLLGVGDGRLIAYDLGDDGSLGTLRAPVDVDPVLATVDRLDYMPDADGSGLLALAGGGVYRMDMAGDLAPVALLEGPQAALGLAGAGSAPILMTATPHGVQVASVHAVEGVIALDAVGMSDGLGVNAPTALATVSAHGAQFVILGAAGTHSLSVVEVAADGTLHARDHLIDSLFSRFADLQDIAVAQVAGQVFVVAGGSDDGLSLLTLLPDGRLIHLDSIASAVGASLDGVTRLSATHAQDALQVFAATQGDAGLAHLSVPMANIGDVVRGTGVLSGGAGDDLLVAEGTEDTLSGGPGDDILVAGPSGTTLSGGSGADLFVMRSGGGVVRITDFDLSQDRLDLSDYTMLRNPDQLSVTSLSDGAQIVFRDEVVVIQSHDGAPLGRDDLFGYAFEGPDRITLFTAPGGTPPEPDPLPDPDPPPDPVPDPDPAPAPDPDPGTIPDADRLLVIRPQEANPWLAGAEIMFMPEDEGAGMIAIQADDEGRFDLSEAVGETGQLHIVRGYSAGDPAFGVGDALDVLRLAVGLEPSFGPATPADRIAADFDQDGTIGVADALDVLRLAVGLSTDTAPDWLFLDPDADLSAVLAGVEPIPEGLHLSVPEATAWEFSVTAILPGNVDGVL